MAAEAPLEDALHQELVDVMQRVPELAGRRLRLSVLSGGITNRNFRVDAGGRVGGGGQSYVIRLAGNDTHLLGISREVEHAASLAAAEVGVGPEVVAFLRPEGYLLTRFIVGSPVPDEVVHRPETIRRVAESIRRLHDGPAIPGIFMAYEVAQAYRELAVARGVVIPAAYGEALEVVRRVEIARLQRPEPMRPCHNDLLNANFIDDGERIRIVDYEYAGLGDPFFDLGNFSVNHGLEPVEEAALLEAYEGRVEPERLARLRLMRLASDLREAMWGVLQQAISSLDVDFVAYAQRHFERLLRNAADPSFGRDLRTVGG